MKLIYVFLMLFFTRYYVVCCHFFNPKLWMKMHLYIVLPFTAGKRERFSLPLGRNLGLYFCYFSFNCNV
uniref:Putative secreted protein n=1 Tax=Lutzomyia longipalpis TaxID=7200 RepID=A0A7G3AQ29_LUTLO